MDSGKRYEHSFSFSNRKASSLRLIFFLLEKLRGRESRSFQHLPDNKKMKMCQKTTPITWFHILEIIKRIRVINYPNHSDPKPISKSSFLKLLLLRINPHSALIMQNVEPTKTPTRIDAFWLIFPWGVRALSKTIFLDVDTAADANNDKVVY